MSILLPHRLDFQFQFIFPLVPVFNVEWHFHDLRFFVCVWVAFDSLRVDYKKVLKYSGKQSWGLLPLKNYVFLLFPMLLLATLVMWWLWEGYVGGGSCSQLPHGFGVGPSDDQCLTPQLHLHALEVGKHSDCRSLFFHCLVQTSGPNPASVAMTTQVGTFLRPKAGWLIQRPDELCWWLLVYVGVLVISLEATWWGNEE